MQCLIIKMVLQYKRIKTFQSFPSFPTIPLFYLKTSVSFENTSIADYPFCKFNLIPIAVTMSTCAAAAGLEVWIREKTSKCIQSRTRSKKSVWSERIMAGLNPEAKRPSEARVPLNRKMNSPQGLQSHSGLKEKTSLQLFQINQSRIRNRTTQLQKTYDPVGSGKG